MRIMFVCDTMGAGGAERVIATLANAFVRDGESVSILTLSNEVKESFYSLDKRVTLLNLHNSQGFFQKAKAIKSTVVEHKIDIVISFLSYVCIYTWWALRRTGIPYIVSERNDPNQRGYFKQLLLNKAFRKAAGCVFQTEDAFGWYKKIVHNKGTVIHNPVSLDIIPAKNRDIKKQILYVGRLTEQKNCLMLLEAFSLFNQHNEGYSLKMYGDGPLKSLLIEYVKSNNLIDKVEILPSSKTWQKDECDSAMFVLPSKYEGMPNVLAEALCLGIPSISTNCTIGGPKELKNVFPDLLILSETDSSQDFAFAMEKALSIKSKGPCVPEALSINRIACLWMNYIRTVKGGGN